VTIENEDTINLIGNPRLILVEKKQAESTVGFTLMTHASITRNDSYKKKMILTFYLLGVDYCTKLY
jgi:hypothetical protein